MHPVISYITIAATCCFSQLLKLFCIFHRHLVITYSLTAVLTHNSTSALTKPPTQSFPSPTSLSHWVRYKTGLVVFIFKHLTCSQNLILSIGYGSLRLPVPPQHPQQSSVFNSFHTAWCACTVKTNCAYQISWTFYSILCLGVGETSFTMRLAVYGTV